MFVLNIQHSAILFLEFHNISVKRMQCIGYCRCSQRSGTEPSMPIIHTGNILLDTFLWEMHWINPIQMYSKQPRHILQHILIWYIRLIRNYISPDWVVGRYLCGDKGNREHFGKGNKRSWQHRPHVLRIDNSYRIIDTVCCRLKLLCSLEFHMKCLWPQVCMGLAIFSRVGSKGPMGPKSSLGSEICWQILGFFSHSILGLCLRQLLI